MKSLLRPNWLNFTHHLLLAGALGLACLIGLPNQAIADPLPSALPEPPPPAPKPPKPKGPQIPTNVTVFADLKYGPDGAANLLDIYLPEKTNEPLPLIVSIHGGGWANGDKTANPTLFQFVSHGFAVASINYRLSGEAPFPAQIYDCKGAIRWLRAHAKEYHIDPDRIGVWGMSAGGHLVALLGTSGGVKEVEGDVGGNLNVSSRVQAVSDYAGPTDMLQFWDQGGSNNVFKNNRFASYDYIDHLFGQGPLEDHKGLVRMANPITYLTADAPPFQVVHGDKDTSVPFGQGQLLVDALKAKGVSCEFIPVKGAGHGFGQLQYRATIAFFEKQLMKSAPASEPSKPKN